MYDVENDKQKAGTKENLVIYQGYKIIAVRYYVSDSYGYLVFSSYNDPSVIINDLRLFLEFETYTYNKIVTDSQL